MTPKFLYDPDQHCLREVARMEEPALSEFKTNAYWMAMDVYNDHLASLRVIPCATGSKWPEGELEEDVDFRVKMRMYQDGKKYAFPITKQTRLYTQAEAEEIWDAAERIGVQCYAACKSSKEDKQQYFKTRFNVEL